MTLEEENQLIDTIQSIEARKRVLIRQIVVESLAGNDTESSLALFGELSRQYLVLTRPKIF